MNTFIQWKETISDAYLTDTPSCFPFIEPNISPLPQGSLASIPSNALIFVCWSWILFFCFARFGKRMTQIYCCKNPKNFIIRIITRYWIETKAVYGTDVNRASVNTRTTRHFRWSFPGWLWLLRLDGDQKGIPQRFLLPNCIHKDDFLRVAIYSPLSPFRGTGDQFTTLAIEENGRCCFQCVSIS